jgi:hypothetical protein
MIRDKTGEKSFMLYLQEIHPVAQELVNGLKGAAPGVQVERRSTAGTGSGIVELKAMGLGAHVEYTSGANKLKDDEKK